MCKYRDVLLNYIFSVCRLNSCWLYLRLFVFEILSPLEYDSVFMGEQ